MSEDDWTALHEAAHRGQTHCVSSLLTGEGRVDTPVLERQLHQHKDPMSVLSQIFLGNFPKKTCVE